MRGLVTLLHYFLFIVVIEFSCCNGYGHKAFCREEEREALLSFKKGVYDPSNTLSSWVSEECCKWEGVLCHNTTGHVLQLNLRSNGLRGEINSSLLHLKHLQYLDLSDNFFGGASFYKDLQSIPKFIGSLSNLRYLNLSNAGFGGVIPRELGNLSKLHYLDIAHSDSNVEDLEWISGLPCLEYLDMTYVNLSKASNWLQVMNKLHSLSVLVLSSCELLAVDPLPHVNFSSLLILDLSKNDLISSSFDWFADLSSLTTLNLAYNQIHGQIPSGLRNMTSLKFLDLSNNNFVGSFPDWLYHMTALEHLDFGSHDLRSNMLQGKLLNDIGNLSSITYLDLSNNALEGDILRSLGNLCAFQLSKFSYLRQGKSLEFLNLRANKLSGSFPDTLGECKCLIRLDLGENQLSGNLPNDLGQLKSLHSLSIDRNSFSGKIPISLGGISSLSYLNIGENLFKGIVSEKHLANLTSLKALHASSHLQLSVQVSSNWTPPFQLSSLDLGSCLLGPPFPAWLQTQMNLFYLDMSYAGISGVIPAWFWTRSYFIVDLSHNQIVGNIPSLRSTYIDLGSNNFTGPLPQILSDVRDLDLSNNVFRGSLSPMLCRSKGENSLLVLDISRNLLSGELPNCWMHWRYLTRLKLNNNNLTGGIPSSMGSLNWLGSLHLNNNHLSGDFPLSLKYCSSLMVVDLSENEFTGSIPAWMGNFIGKFIATRFIPTPVDIRYMPGLMVLVLRSNKFNGSIPLELCHIDSLQILDLGNNNLSGTIPRCFGNFSGMIKQSNSTSAFPFHQGYGLIGESTDTATLVMKGLEYEYDNTLGLLSGIDLSSNKLSGGIPEELTSLHGLIFLNLSHNHLQGKIPVKIGAMTSLESLDLSMNRLSGFIPQGMATISFLSHLNLSYNNLSGKIPSGTQLQGFSPFSFIGNPELCGAPLTDDCGEDGKPEAPIPENDREDDSGWIDMKWFYLGMPWGFAVGFWAIFAPLALKRAWRLAYFQFLDEMKCKLLGWCS